MYTYKLVVANSASSRELNNGKIILNVNLNLLNIAVFRPYSRYALKLFAAAAANQN